MVLAPIEYAVIDVVLPCIPNLRFTLLTCTVQGALRVGLGEPEKCSAGIISFPSLDMMSALDMIVNDDINIRDIDVGW